MVKMDAGFECCSKSRLGGRSLEVTYWRRWIAIVRFPLGFSRGYPPRPLEFLQVIFYLHFLI